MSMTLKLPPELRRRQHLVIDAVPVPTARRRDLPTEALACEIIRLDPAATGLVITSHITCVDARFTTRAEFDQRLNRVELQAMLERAGRPRGEVTDYPPELARGTALEALAVSAATLLLPYITVPDCLIWSARPVHLNALLMECLMWEAADTDPPHALKRLAERYDESGLTGLLDLSPLLALAGRAPLPGDVTQLNGRAAAEALIAMCAG